MHTSSFESGNGNEYSFHYNGDYSGDVTIVLPGDSVQLNEPVINPRTGLAKNESTAEVKVPFEVLRDFVVGKLRKDMVESLENMTDAELWELMTF